jgi:hypothetical protein
MARIRTIKPDAFKSDSLSAVPRGVRWTYAGLWTYADDAGRGRDDARLLKAELYPLDDEVTLAVVTDDMKRLEHVGCICRYEIGGKAYFHIVKWKHQRINRPGESTLPPCPNHHPDEDPVSNHGGLTEPSVNDHGALSEGSREERKGKEQGKEGKGTRARATSSDPLFDEFWQAYPRKTDKGNARKAWDKAVKKTSGRSIILAAAAYAATKPEPKFTAHPSTWLNGERWDDQPLTLIPGGQARVNGYAPDDVRARFQ